MGFSFALSKQTRTVPLSQGSSIVRPVMLATASLASWVLALAVVVMILAACGVTMALSIMWLDRWTRSKRLSGLATAVTLGASGILLFLGGWLIVDAWWVFAQLVRVAWRAH
jgi:hypothetical protein